MMSNSATGVQVSRVKSGTPCSRSLASISGQGAKARSQQASARRLISLYMICEPRWLIATS